MSDLTKAKTLLASLEQKLLAQHNITTETVMFVADLKIELETLQKLTAKLQDKAKLPPERRLFNENVTKEILESLVPAEIKIQRVLCLLDEQCVKYCEMMLFKEQEKAHLQAQSLEQKELARHETLERDEILAFEIKAIDSVMEVIKKNRQHAKKKHAGATKKAKQEKVLADEQVEEERLQREGLYLLLAVQCADHEDEEYDCRCAIEDEDVFFRREVEGACIENQAAIEHRLSSGNSTIESKTRVVKISLILNEKWKIVDTIGNYTQLHNDMNESNVKVHSIIVPILQRIDSSKKYIAVLLGHGGYFAGAVFDFVSEEVVTHKTFARYVTRRGQGGRQSNHSGRTDTAGSQMRAFHEKKWIAEVKELIASWGSYFASCALIMYHAPGPVNSAMMLDNIHQPQCYKIPFSTSRPTFAETQYVFNQLTLGTVLHS